MVRKCVVYCIIFKNVSKEIKKVTQGLVRDRGKVWFPELSDKRKNLLNVHVYPSNVCIKRKKYKDPPVLGDEKLRKVC